MDFLPDISLCREVLNCSRLHPSGRFSSPFGRLSVFDKLQDFFSKHSYGKIVTTVRTRLSIRQVSQFKSRRQDDDPHGPNARASDMEIACIKPTVRTIILLVRTSEAFIRKLLAADVRPSGRQGTTVRTQLKNRKEFLRNSWTIDRTVVLLDDP